MEIYQTTKKYSEMRYPTAGDYHYHLGIDLFKFVISQMDSSDYEALIFLHEFIEAYLCWKARIKEEDIASFDILFEKERAEGLHKPEDEPGNDRRAPYYKQHQIATVFEMRFCDKLGIDWNEYEKALMEL